MTLLGLLLLGNAVLHGVIVGRFGIKGNEPPAAFGIVYAGLGLAVFAGLAHAPLLAMLVTTVGLLGLGLNFKKLQHEPTVEKIIIVVGIAILVCAAVALRQGDFDAAAWRSDATEHDGTRVGMVDSLLEDHPISGMRLSEVDALLGADDSSRGTGFGAGYFADYDRVWYLGPERGFISIDSEWLVLRANADGNVVEARVVRD